MVITQLSLFIISPINNTIISCIPRSGRKLKICYAFFAFFLLFVSGAAKTNAQPKGIFKQYTTENGLSHDGVLCMTRDKDGFMWFGTWDGINRFDGHNFVVYKSQPGDSSSLKNNKIRAIIEDQAGYLWIKTYDSRIYRFDKKTERFIAIPNSKKFEDLVLDKVVPVSNGNNWIITVKQGLLCAMNNPISPVPQIYKYSKTEKGGFNIPSDNINFVFEDSKKGVWVGTEHGLSRMIEKKGRFYQNSAFKNKQNSYGQHLSFTSSAQKGNKLYFGTEQGILVIFDLASETFTTKTILENARLNNLYFSKGNVLYISTIGKGLIAVNTLNSKISVANKPGLNSFYSIYEDKRGQIWLEPEREGVVKYNPGTKEFKLFTQKKESDIASPNKNYTVFEDVNGVLWTGLKGGGFGYYNPANDRVEYFYNNPESDDSRFSNIATAIYPDKTGVFWISTIDGGLNKIIFPGNNFNYKLLATQPENKKVNEVRALFEDSKRRIWVGTKSGALHVLSNGKKVDNIFTNLSLDQIGNVYSIIEEAGGTIWLGTKGKGLFMAQPVNSDRSKYTVTQFTNSANDKHSISSNMVYSVLQDKKGRIWVGTLGGGLNLIYKSNGKLLFRNSNNSFANYPGTGNVIRHIQEGPSGKIWIATTDGLVILNPDVGQPHSYRFLKYSKIPGDSTSLGNNDVQFIHRDRSGQMWVGTFGGGLNKVISVKGEEKLKFRIFTKKDGLPNDIILSIAEDKRGNLWLATENGLSVYNRAAGTFKNYDSYDGLPQTAFSEAACFRSYTGDLYFGLIEGYISFNPEKISNRKANAFMALTNIQVYNKDLIAGETGSPLKYSLNNTDRITLTYDQDVISIHYAVLDYRANHKMSYSYILKGYDKVWHDVKNQRKASYTNLPPGNYEFIVKTTNPDLFNNMPSKSIKITILPPPWRTVWAYLAYALIAIILIEVARRIALTMIRLRNKVAIEHKLIELKLQFFTNISHELRTPLTLIVSPLEELSRTEQVSPKGRENINIVNRNANRMIRFVNQLLDFRKVQSGKMKLRVSEIDVVKLTKDIGKYFTGLAHEKNIELHINSDTEKLYAWLDEEKLDIVIYNLLSNAFKFSPGNTSIRVQISRMDKEFFSISITDQGYGIPKDKIGEIFQLYYEGDKQSENNMKGTGIGLALSKELINLHNGTISAVNNVEAGMTFTLKLRMGKAHFKNADVDFVNSEEQSSFIKSDYIGALNSDDSYISSAPVYIDDAEKQLVLLVEDNPELRAFLAGQLSVFYRVVEAEDGVEGLKTAIDLLPDLILSDIMMPNMDGIKMLDLLKHNSITSHIPIILLSAKSAIESQIEGLRYGADFYITKPFHTDHILMSVSNLLMQRRRLFESLLANDKKIVQLKPDEILITSRDEEFLNAVLRIVEERIEDSEFNIDNVAEAVGLGRTTFYKKLKSLTGQAPVEFVKDMRLQRAKQLLDTGSFTISEVAYKIGFSSSGYFSTCFKEKYKQSPSDYLKSIKSNTSNINKT